MFKECFDSVHTDDFMKSCFFICRDFKLNGHSEYWDGNLTNLYGLYLEILEFLNQQNIPYSYDQEVDENFLRSLNNELFKNDEEETKSDRKLDDFVDESYYTGNRPVYKSVKKVLQLEALEPVFIDEHTGIDLIRLYGRSKFDINLEDFI